MCTNISSIFTLFALKLIYKNKVNKTSELIDVQYMNKCMYMYIIIVVKTKWFVQLLYMYVAQIVPL